MDARHAPGVALPRRWVFRQMNALAFSAENGRDGIVRHLLVQGGDERIALDPATGRNRYGCGAAPDDCLAFGSSTASSISAQAFASLAPCAERLLDYPSPSRAYAVETEIARRRLARLCGLPTEAAANIVLAPSGTDLHLIAADLARGASLAPLVTVMADPAETGRGVPDAVRSRRFATASAHGAACIPGQPLPGAPEGRLATVALRHADGAPRSVQAVDDDVERLCRSALTSGAQVLLVLVDVSKTGLMGPSQACAVALKQQFPALMVLVDACQFRLSPASLAAYLADDILVAVTGSKFVAGPAFSGALIIPEASAPRLHRHALLPALGDYSSRHDWPAAFVGRAVLPDLPNLGLLMRWLAALDELTGFHAYPPKRIADFMRAFAARVEDRLDTCAGLERLPTPKLQRADPMAWDSVPTIFPFLLRDGAGVMDPERVKALHARLRDEGLGATQRGASSRRVELGQPVSVGVRDGQPLSALRLCLSARLVCEALGDEAGKDAVIGRALTAIDIVAEAAQAR